MAEQLPPDLVSQMRGEAAMHRHYKRDWSAQLMEKAANEIKRAQEVIREAVNPHAFNCGYVKHPTLIKMIPVEPKRCTCGAGEFLK